MPAFGLEPQVVMTTPLLEGLDGVEKMSKSLGNYVGVTDPPSEMFGKLMSISDDLMWRYYTLLTDLTPDAIARDARGAVERGELHPEAGEGGARDVYRARTFTATRRRARRRRSSSAGSRSARCRTTLAERPMLRGHDHRAPAARGRVRAVGQRCGAEGAAGRGADRRREVHAAAIAGGSARPFCSRSGVRCAA